MARLDSFHSWKAKYPKRAGEHYEQGHDDHEHAADATRLLEMRMLHRIGLAVAAARLGGHGGRDLVAEHGLVARLEAFHRVGVVFRGIALVLEAGSMRAVGGRDGRERLGQAERRVAVGRATLLGGVAGADGRERLGQTQGWRRPRAAACGAPRAMLKLCLDMSGLSLENSRSAHEQGEIDDRRDDDDSDADEHRLLHARHGAGVQVLERLLGAVSRLRTAIGRKGFRLAGVSGVRLGGMVPAGACCAACFGSGTATGAT